MKTSNKLSVREEITAARVVFEDLVRQDLFPLAKDPQFCHEISLLISSGNCTSIVETGTFQAESTRFYARAFQGIPVYSCDVMEDFVSKAQQVLEGFPNAYVKKSSSPEFIRGLVAGKMLGDNPFFFLDAHWYDYLPLKDELREILTLGKGIICIHDFKVPDESAFGYDVYAGSAIDVEMVMSVLRETEIPFRIYFPPSSSSLFTIPCRDGSKAWNFAKSELFEKYELRGRCYILLNQEVDLLERLEILSELNYFTAYTTAFSQDTTVPRNRSGRVNASADVNPRSPFMLQRSLQASLPKIDLIVPGPESLPFSWNQREGWISTLKKNNMLNELYWIWDDQKLIEGLFASLEKSTADFILILCGDHHLSCLHNSEEKKRMWNRVSIPVLCHSIERVLGSPFPNTVEMTKSAVSTYDAFIYIDELSAHLFESSGKPNMWIPQYIDDEIFRSEVPFESRENRIYFRGKTITYGIEGVYSQRRALLTAIQHDPLFCLSEADEKAAPIQVAAAEKAEYRFVLNAPANCTGYSSSLYEGLACGCAVFQYSLPGLERKSNSLFRPGHHFVEYSAADTDAFLQQARYASQHWKDFKEIARQGYEECLSKHTIEIRLQQVIDFMNENWSCIVKGNRAERIEKPRPDVDGCGAETKSALEEIIPAEIKDDEFYHAIRNLAETENLRSVLEIGSSSGAGSTEAFVSGLKLNSNNSTLYCMEVSRARFAELQKRYAKDGFVKCYNVSSVSLQQFPSENEISDFYRTVSTALNNYPLAMVLGWLQQDMEYVETSGVPADGIQRIKRENNIETFDLVLIDGSEFTGSAELEEVYGARIIILDDVNAYKNYFNYRRLKFDSNYVLVAENWSLRNGYAIFRLNEKSKQPSVLSTEEQNFQTTMPPASEVPSVKNLPVHFFTIVLNGKPFIEKHISAFEKLPFPWHWHIIEGVAALKHDTAWSLANGGRIDDSLHKNGLSNDGTTEYLDDLVRKYPDQVTVYRKNSGEFWDGKLEMVQAPLESVREECLLWQVDVDEIWTIEQITAARELFIQSPEKSAALYLCQFFVGPSLVTTTVNTYGNYLGSEWLRTWRFRPGDRWLAHEPPRLVRQQGGMAVDVATINPFMHAETVEKGLVFHHYAYATEGQIRFKEVYYGYKGAVEQWRALQSADSFPVKLKDYFSWVNDEAKVDRYEGDTYLDSAPERILWIRTDAIGDNVLASGMLPYIREHYPAAHITVLCQDRVAQLYQDSPCVDQIISFNWWKAFHEESYRQQILGQIQAVNADLALNSVYSREALNDFFAIGSFAPERIALHGDESNIKGNLRDENNTAYTRIISTEGVLKSEMERHRDFLQGIGISAPALQPLIWTTSEDDRFADEFFSRHGLDPEKTVACYPSGQWAGKFYERYPEALNGPLLDNGLSVIMFGGEGEREINNGLLGTLVVPGVNAAGETTIRQTAAIIRRCKIGIGADTGTAHIASAVGTPHVVVLWGGHFGRFFPYSPLTSVVCLPLECYGCNWQCSYSRPHCVKDIDPSVVEAAFRETLAKGSDLPRIFTQEYDSWKPGPGEPAWVFFTRFINHRAVTIVPVSGKEDDRLVNYS